MIYVRILNTKNLTSTDVTKKIRALPFGQDETDRLLAIKKPDKQLESLGALTALSQLISEYTEHTDIRDATIVRDDSDNGKPRFENDLLPRFSLAHSCGFCAAALSDDEVGIDLELIRPHPHKQELAQRFFNEREKKLFSEHDTDENFLLLWTQKEALVKLHGSSLAASLGKALPDAKRVFCDTVSIGDKKLALTVCSQSDDDVALTIAPPTSKIQDTKKELI